MRYEHTTGLLTSTPRYLAVVVKSNGKASAYPLGDAALIDTAVANYRRHIANVKSLNTDEYIAISYDLYSLIWQPFETQIGGMSAVFVSPDAALSLVSFAGLRTSDSDYLIEHYPIHFVSSGRDMVREPTVPAKTSGLLAMGDPDYDATAALRSGQPQGTALSNLTGGLIGGFTRGATSSCRALRDMVVGRIPATRSEISEIVRQWQSASSEPAVTLFDAQASEDAFKKQSHGIRVLHLATHGYYISNECRPDKSSAGFVGESPLLESGLFFAGANLKGQGAADAKVEDGTLTAEEVAGLNLNGTDLVVLSACETGLGEVRSGEGVFGLRRAFQMAGAKTVISALWPVDDKSTADLMGSLFAAREQNIYDAMRQAALKTIQARRAAGKSDHPFYWAGFVATGDWKTQ
jgi:CHAT domain-containing protein